MTRIWFLTSTFVKTSDIWKKMSSSERCGERALIKGPWLCFPWALNMKYVRGSNCYGKKRGKLLLAVWSNLYWKQFALEYQGVRMQLKGAGVLRNMNWMCRSHFHRDSPQIFSLRWLLNLWVVNVTQSKVTCTRSSEKTRNTSQITLC